MPDRNAVFVWAADSVRRDFGIVIVDSGTSLTLTNTRPWPAALNPRKFVSLSYDGTRIHVFYGLSSNNDNGGIYDVASDSWTQVPSTTTPACGTGGAHGETPTAFARGVVNAFGGYNADGTDFCRANEAFGYDIAGSSWLPIARNATAGFRHGHTWLSVGGRVFMSGGICPGNAACNDAWLFDPGERSMDGWTRLANPPAPASTTSSAFALFTGKSIILYGGFTPADFSGLAGGSVGVVSGTTVRWSALPSSGAPSARHNFALESEGSTQGLWSGREAIIWGGSNNAARFADGARYQPPVGCVCPMNSDAPSHIPGPCAGVPSTGLPACSP